MSMASIRKTYGVPAKRGMQVTYTGLPLPLTGTIVGSRGLYLRVRLDYGMGRTHIVVHPTWKITYEAQR